MKRVAVVVAQLVIWTNVGCLRPRHDLRLAEEKRAGSGRRPSEPIFSAPRRRVGLPGQVTTPMPPRPSSSPTSFRDVRHVCFRRAGGPREHGQAWNCQRFGVQERGGPNSCERVSTRSSQTDREWGKTLVILGFGSLALAAAVLDFETHHSRSNSDAAIAGAASKRVRLRRCPVTSALFQAASNWSQRASTCCASVTEIALVRIGIHACLACRSQVFADQLQLALTVEKRAAEPAAISSYAVPGTATPSPSNAILRVFCCCGGKARFSNPRSNVS